MIVQTVIDIQKVFESTWGYIGLPYPEILINRFLKSNKVQLADNYSFATWGKNDSTDLCVPLYGSDKENGYNNVFSPIWLFEADNAKDSEKYLLPLSLMSLSCKKHIVTTPLVNRNGTVKEEISREDWEINVRGVIVGLDNNYPDNQVQIMKNWFDMSMALNIQNAKTAICLSEGEKVIITSLSLPECKGFENTQPYELKLVSDVQFSLYV
jgi:hypothetical protein